MFCTDLANPVILAHRLSVILDARTNCVANDDRDTEANAEDAFRELQI